MRGFMFPDLPNGGADEQSKTAPPGIQQIPLLPFAVQLQNIFPVEIKAKRFPIDKVIDMASVVSTAHTHLNLSDLSIDTESLLAQIHLEVSVRFPQEPRLFEIYFKLVGIFSYSQNYESEMVQQFLRQGSLGVMLPSARELLLSLCTRLQVPMVVLPLIQLASPSSSPEAEK
jgi:hypothetical protein